MANVVSGNPLVLDTVAVGAISPFNRTMIKIRHIEYVDYAVASEPFLLSDSVGRVVWSGVGSQDFDPVISQEVGWVKGLVVTTLVAPGRFLVYL